MFGIHTRRGKENSNQHFVSPGLSTVFLGRHRVVVYSIYFFKSSFLNCHVFQLSPPRVCAATTPDFPSLKTFSVLETDVYNNNNTLDFNERGNK